MELFTIKIDVTGQSLTIKQAQLIASGDEGVDFVEFTFKDDRWNSFTDFFAVFSRLGGSPLKIPLVENKAEIPSEVMVAKGRINIGLFAVNDTDVLTSTVVSVELLQGAIRVEDVTPTLDLYEQFIADLNAYNTAVSELDEVQDAVSGMVEDVGTLQSDISQLQGQAGDIERSLDNSQETFEGYVERCEQAVSDSYILEFEIDSRGHLMLTKS